MASDSSSSSAGALNQIVEGLLNKQRFEEWDDDWLLEHYPNLMPDLKEQLRTAQAIRDAAQRAKLTHSISDCDDSDHPYGSEEEIDYLNQELEGYHIHERIGRGGQAAVYQGIQESTGRTVAVKVLPEGPLASPAQRARFQREISLISRLRHPNIVDIFEGGVVKGHHWYSMQFVEGATSLEDYALMNDTSIKMLVKIVEQVARAIGFAHEQGILHRDVKPSNVLVNLDGVPHVVDFGLAKDMRETAESMQVSMRGQVLGTLPYLSPEQAFDIRGDLDVRTDIYAMGVLLFRLTTGRFPYRVDGSNFEVRRAILLDDPMRPQKARAQSEAENACLPSGTIDGDLEQIMHKCLQKDKERRYSTAIALADDLRRYLKGEAVEAKADDPIYVLKKKLRRYRTQVMVSSAFVLLLAASLVSTTLLWRKAVESRERAEHISFLAQVGLDSGGYLKLGSVYRDEGRNDQALAMFEKAIEITRLTDDPDLIIMKNRFDAFHRMAWLSYMLGNLEQGDVHREAAREIVERMNKQNPQDLQWIRFLALSHELSYSQARIREDWGQALDHCLDAKSAFQRVIDKDPNNTSLKKDLARCLRSLGNCRLELNQPSEAEDCYLESKAISQQLAKLDPTVVEHKLDTIRCEYKIARCHIREKRRAEYEHAISILTKCHKALEKIRPEAKTAGLLGDFDILQTNVSKFLLYSRDKLSELEDEVDKTAQT